jgi:hypothetical protein
MATTIDKIDFFHKYLGSFNQDKSYKLTLNLIVLNNLQLSLVKSVLFKPKLNTIIHMSLYNHLFNNIYGLIAYSVVQPISCQTLS